MEWVLELHHLLESCNFESFWKKLEESSEVVAMVPNFEASIRNCEPTIGMNVSFAYSRLEKCFVF